MNRSTPGMVTIVDVAREAGVSYVTVSRVMNGEPYVRSETRERVAAALDKMGPAHRGRHLRRQRVQVVGGGRSPI